MRRAGRTLLLGAGLLLAARPAAAQSLDADPADSASYYQGLVFTIDVNPGTANLTWSKAQVTLPDDLVLLEVAVASGAVIFPDAQCGAIGQDSFDCSGTCSAAECLGFADGIGVTAVRTGVTSPTDLTFTSPTQTQGWPVFRLTVALRPQDACSEATVTFSNDAVSWSGGVGPYVSVCDQTLAALQADPVSVTAPRGGGTQSIVLMGRRSDGTQVSIRAPVTTASGGASDLFTAAVRCSAPESGASNVVCSDPSFAGLAAVTPASDSPVTLAVTPVNTPQPIPGGGSIRIDPSALLKVTTTAAPLVIDLAIEQPVASVLYEVLDGGSPLPDPGAQQPYPVSPGRTYELRVRQATNTLGGFEPPTASSWRIVSATYDNGQPADTQGWLQPLQTDGGATSLQIPADALDLAGADSLDLVVHAIHTTTSGQSSEVADDLALQVRRLPVTGCRLTVDPPRVFVGRRAALVLEADRGGTLETITSGVTWTLEPQSGEVVTTAAGYDYIAGPAPGTVRVRAETEACPAPIEADVEVTGVVDVRLTADREDLLPGQMVRLTASFDNLDPDTATSLLVSLRLAPALKSLRKLPRGTSGLEPRAPAASGEDTAAAAPAGTAGPSFVVDLPPGARNAALTLPVLARAAASSIEASAAVEARYATADSSSAPLASASVRLRIGEDRELTEATLFGKVFHDANGNGVQDEGEAGIAGAMVALSAGMYAVTDEQGKYHMARVPPGRHALKVSTATLPLGAEGSPELRREITLTPGMPTRVSFGVRLPDLSAHAPLTLLGDRSGVEFSAGRPIYHARLAGGLAASSLTATHGETLVQAIRGGDGVWTLDLPVDADAPHWLLVERAADGRTWIASFAVHVYPREHGGSLVIPWGPRPVAALLLPPARRIASTKLVLAGQAAAAVAIEVTAAPSAACAGSGTQAGCERATGGAASVGRPATAGRPGDAQDAATNGDAGAVGGGEIGQARGAGRGAPHPERAAAAEPETRASTGGKDRSGGGVCAVAVEHPGALHCDLEVDAELTSLALRVDPGPDSAGDDAPAQLVRVPVEVEPSSHFLVGLAGVELSSLLAREKGEDPVFWDGGGEFFYRGQISGGWQLTAGADATARDLLLKPDGSLRSFAGIGSRLLAHDRRRIFRDLDPEEDYPVYGDASVTVDERESGGRFFLRVRKGPSFLKWGGVNTGIDDAEVGRYVRSLYGLAGALALGDGSRAGLRAVAFAAQPDTQAARDELTVTGGSLYFLGHQDLVEGSIRVTLEILDELSGLPLRAVTLVEGSDFEADYNGGRIVLDPALPYRTFGTSITGAAGGGHSARLIVDYEFVPGVSVKDGWSTGGRLVGRYGPLELGATGVTELEGLAAGGSGVTARYTLLGGTLRLDLGAPLRVRAEVAHSTGDSAAMSRSIDGGLSLETGATDPDRSGNAAVLELSTDLGAVQAHAYGRWLQPGFTDSRTAPGRRLVQGGLRLDASLAPGARLWASYDHRESRLREVALPGPLVIRDLALAGGSLRVGDFQLTLEGRYEALPRQDEQRTVAAAELSYRLSPRTSLSVRRRELVPLGAGAKWDGETAIAILLGRAHELQLAAEVGASDAGKLFGRAQGSVPVGDATELYAGYRLASHLAASLDPTDEESGSSLVAGGKRSLADGTLLYSEQSLKAQDGHRVLTRSVGGQIPLSRRSTLSVAYERGGLEGEEALDPALVRDAASVGGVFAGERVTLRLAASGRLDREGDARAAELGLQGRIELRATEDLTFALAGRGATTYGAHPGGSLQPGRMAWEGALGFALRPVSHDRINLFGRYALESDRQREDAGDAASPWLSQTSHVAALAAVVELWGPLALTPKIAYRNTRLSGEGIRSTDQALLAALRGDVHLSGSWDAALEGRACAAPQTRLETRYGALAELSMLALDWLRLGAGYNFSSISTQGVRCEEPGARGLYLRAEAVY